MSELINKTEEDKMTEKTVKEKKRKSMNDLIGIVSDEDTDAVEITKKAGRGEL